MEPKQTVLIAFCLLKYVFGLKEGKWERAVGTKFESPYLAEYKAEVNLCLDLCLQVYI